VSLGVLCDTFETACSWDRFDALHAAVTKATLGALREACGAERSDPYDLKNEKPLTRFT
jgi:alkyldihydroxyacetonephosphate synthase